MRSRQVHSPRLDDPRRPCDGRVAPRLGHASKGQVPPVVEWRCACGQAQVPVDHVKGEPCELCTAPSGPMRHCGRAHARVTTGSHPEPSITLRIPVEDVPIADVIVHVNPDAPEEVGRQTIAVLRAEATLQHHAVVALPLGLWRPVHYLAALYLAGIRRRTGPWVDVRLAPGHWTIITRRLSGVRKASDAVPLLAEPQIAERFCDLFRPYEIA